MVFTLEKSWIIIVGLPWASWHWKVALSAVIFKQNITEELINGWNYDLGITLETKRLRAKGWDCKATFLYRFEIRIIISLPDGINRGWVRFKFSLQERQIRSFEKSCNEFHGAFIFHRYRRLHSNVTLVQCSGAKKEVRLLNRKNCGTIPLYRTHSGSKNFSHFFCQLPGK